MLTVLQKKLTQVTVLAKNVVVQGGEDHPCQYVPQVIPIPKRKGGKMRVV